MMLLADAGEHLPEPADPGSAAPPQTMRLTKAHSRAVNRQSIRPTARRSAPLRDPRESLQHTSCQPHMSPYRHPSEPDFPPSLRREKIFPRPFPPPIFPLILARSRPPSTISRVPRLDVPSPLYSPVSRSPGLSRVLSRRDVPVRRCPPARCPPADIAAATQQKKNADDKNAAAARKSDQQSILCTSFFAPAPQSPPSPAPARRLAPAPQRPAGRRGRGARPLLAGSTKLETTLRGVERRCQRETSLAIGARARYRDRGRAAGTHHKGEGD